MNAIKILVKNLRKKGIILNYFEENLEIQQVDNLDVSENDIVLIREHKQDIITYLKLLLSGPKEHAIQKVKEANHYPVSSSQRRLWIISQVEDSSVSYNMPYHTLLNEAYNIPVFIKAIERVIDRHEILRTVFITLDSGEIRQKIHTKEALGFKIKVIDFREEENIKKRVLDFVEKDAYKPFNLETGPLLRVCLIRVSDSEYEFYFNMHHIISDGWSLKVLMNDVLTSYDTLINHKENQITPLKIQYKDFANWQNTHLERKDIEKDKAFWVNELDGEIIPIDLPSNKTRPNLMTHSGQSLGVLLSVEITNKMRSYCSQKGASLFMGLLASWNILLHRYTSQKDIIIGSPVSGRNHADLENQIGFYVNTVLFRNQIDPKDNFDKIIESIIKSALRVYKHQEYPFNKIVEALKTETILSRNKIFDVLLVLQEESELLVDKPTGKHDIVNLGFRKSKLDLEVVFHNTANGMFLELIYNSDVYDGIMIERLLVHYQVLLEKLLSNTKQSIGTIDYLLEEESQKLGVFNNNEINYYKDKTILGLYKKQLIKNPEGTAISFQNTKLTFKALDRISNQLANYMSATSKIEVNEIIAIQLYRSEWMLITILAILKTGAGYLPMDPDYPDQRLHFIKADSNYLFCIDDKAIDNFINKQESWDTKFQVKDNKPKDMAYVIYTSGSTGLPKGVVNNHEGLCNRLLWMQKDLEITKDDKILQKTPYTFDVSVWELMMPLITGCELVFAKPEGHKDPDYLQEIIKQNRITILHFVPAMLSVFLLDVIPEHCTSLQHVVCSGEALQLGIVKEFKEKLNRVALHNYYGPTEAAIDVTAINLTNEKIENKVSIGVPVPNVNIYITNEALKLQPIGVVGELIIGGIQVARGYLNRERLNKDKFIASPFMDGERLYKTGDLAKWLPNGTIDFIGRKDNQVKIRGNRIEIGEIEKNIQKSNFVSNVVVLVKKDQKNDSRLIAYIVPNKKYDKAVLQNYLRDRLPSYMLPSVFVELSEIPLTANGKINTKAIPDPDLKFTDKSVNIGARNKKEHDLILLWKEILEVEKIGVYDSFFQIGGDSILAIRLISKINKSFGCRLSVGQLYKNQNVASLCEVLNANVDTPDNKIELYDRQKLDIENLKNRIIKQIPNPNNITDIFPLSDIQRGMVFSSLLNPEKAIYHDQFAYQVPKLKIEKFEQALSLMIEKHDILRTMFDLETYEKPVQIVYKTISYKIEYKKLHHLEEIEKIKYITTYIKNERKQQFDFLKAVLWKCSVFNLSETKNVFLFQFHHSILDGWSVASFNTELFQIYSQLESENNYKMQRLKYGYKESVIWELVEKQDEKNIEFWRQELSDYKRLDIFSEVPETNSYSKKYSKEFLKNLKKQAGNDGLTLKTVLLGAYVYALKMLTYEDDLVIGLVSHNRPVVEEGDKILGCFLNTLPVRFNLKKYSTSTWLEYFKALEQEQIKLKNKEALTLFEISKQVRDDSNQDNPFFDVLFDFIDFHIYEDIDKNISQKAKQLGFIQDLSFEATNTFLDLTLSATGGHLNFDYKLSRKLKPEVSLSQLHGYVDKIINYYVTESNKPINTDDIISSSEKKAILSINNNQLSTTDKNIVDLFLNQVHQIPEEIAIVFNDQKITYKELDEITNQFSNYLKSNFSIRSGDLVGVMVERDQWLLITILAIIKLGAAYVPIDVDFPEERKEYIKGDSKYICCIDQQKVQYFIQNQSSFLKQNQSPTINKEDKVYVIYTSGTTGDPKGVMVSHSNLVSFISNLDKEFKFYKGHKIGVTTNVTFDISVLELLGGLCTGKELHLFSIKELMDPVKILEKLETQNIEILQVTPSRLTQLYDANRPFSRSLKIMLVGGEAMDTNLYNKLKKEPFHSINVYGPTETTIWSSYLSIKNSDKLSIGSPLINEQIVILNSNNQLQPKGSIGEICIGGLGVTLGYLNKPILTQNKFIENPYVEGTKLYKTGDLGKWLPDDNIQFLGRKDDQVKIRGYRIELGEVESALLRHKWIESTLVLAKNIAQGEPQLIAYFKAPKAIEIAEIRSFLKSILPVYIIPAYFIQLDEFPLTSSGKIDRKKLPNPNKQTIGIGGDYMAPQTPQEKQISELLINFFGVSKISIDVDFFELGGDSLQAMSFINLFNKRMKQKISLIDLYKNPTIKSLALFLTHKKWLEQEVETDNEMVI